MMTWFGSSIIGVALLTPAWIAIPFFRENFGVSDQVFAAWYFAGAAVFIALFGTYKDSLVPSWPLVGALVLIGFVLGGPANDAVFRAVATAPNAGLAVALINCVAVTTYFASAVLARYLPNHFAPVEFSAQSIIGIGLVLIGAAVLANKS